MSHHNDHNLANLAEELKTTLLAFDSALAKFYEPDINDDEVKQYLRSISGELTWLIATVKLLSDRNIPEERNELLAVLTSNVALLTSLCTKQIPSVSETIQDLLDQDQEEAIKQLQDYKDLINNCTKSSELIKRITPLMQELLTQTEAEWDHHFGQDEKKVNDSRNKKTL